MTFMLLELNLMENMECLVDLLLYITAQIIVLVVVRLDLMLLLLSLPPDGMAQSFCAEMVMLLILLLQELLNLQ